MSTSVPDPTSAGRRDRRVLVAVLAVLAAVVAVALAVVLTRGGADDPAAAADPTGLTGQGSGATEDPAPTDATGATGATGEPGDPVGPEITVDGLPGARLGEEVTDDDPGWVDAERATITGGDADPHCRFVAPTSEPGAPGLGVRGWVVDGRLASVMVLQSDYRIPYVSTPYGIAMDDGLEAAALLPDAESTTETLDEPASLGPDSETALRELGVVTVRDGDREVVYADLGGDRGIDYVEVRDPAAAECVLDDYFVAPVPVEEAPALDADGWGEVRLGRPVTELVELDLVEPEVNLERGPCDVHSPTDAAQDAGLNSVSVLDGQVAGVAVVAGQTEEGLAIGEPAGVVEDVYPDAVPDLGSPPGELSWTVGLADGLRLQVTAATGVVVPDSVDVYLTSVEHDVRLLHLQPTACTG